MKKMLLAGISIFMTVMSFGQAMNKDPLAFYFYPQYLVIHGMKMAIEAPVLMSKLRLSLAPTLYNATSSEFERINPVPDGYDGVNENDIIEGWGTDALIKMQISNKSANMEIRPYVGLGFGYHSITYKFQEYDYRKFMEDGMAFMSYSVGDEEEHLTRWDLMFLTGVNTISNRVLSMDLSIGVVYRIGSIESTMDEVRSDSDTFNSRSMGLRFRFSIGVGFYLPMNKPLLSKN
jgi:hypothetical protein